MKQYADNFVCNNHHVKDIFLYNHFLLFTDSKKTFTGMIGYNHSPLQKKVFLLSL